AVSSVSMPSMKTGIVESSKATISPAANKAANRPFAWRAKCQKKAIKLDGGAACSGGSVGFNSRSKRENMARTQVNGWRARGGAWRPGARLAVIGCARVEKLRVGTLHLRGCR